MKLILSLPPSKNALHVRTRFGIALSHKAREWKRLATTELLLQIEAKELDALRSWTSLGNLCVVEVHTWFPDNRKRDAHNSFEILADVLQDVLDIDDSFFLMRAMSKEISKDDSRVEVSISKHEEALSGNDRENKNNKGCSINMKSRFGKSATTKGSKIKSKAASKVKGKKSIG